MDRSSRKSVKMNSLTTRRVRNQTFTATPVGVTLPIPSNVTMMQTLLPTIFRKPLMISL
jgi:hypothetical protein